MALRYVRYINTNKQGIGMKAAQMQTRKLLARGIWHKHEGRWCVGVPVHITKCLRGITMDVVRTDGRYTPVVLGDYVTSTHGVHLYRPYYQ